MVIDNSIFITLLYSIFISSVLAIVRELIMPWYKNMSHNWIYLDEDLGWGKKLRQNKVTGSIQMMIIEDDYMPIGEVRRYNTNGITIISLSTRPEDIILTNEFADPFKPTKNERLMFELKYGIDYNIPLRRLTYMRKKYDW